MNCVDTLNVDGRDMVVVYGDGDTKIIPGLKKSVSENDVITSALNTIQKLADVIDKLQNENKALKSCVSGQVAQKGEITVNGTTYSVYLTGIEASTFWQEAYRDKAGELNASGGVTKRKFTFMEL